MLISNLTINIATKLTDEDKNNIKLIILNSIIDDMIQDNKFNLIYDEIQAVISKKIRIK